MCACVCDCDKGPLSPFVVCSPFPINNEGFRKKKESNARLCSRFFRFARAIVIPCWDVTGGLRGRCARAAGPPGRRAGDCERHFSRLLGRAIDRPRSTWRSYRFTKRSRRPSRESGHKLMMTRTICWARRQQSDPASIGCEASHCPMSPKTHACTRGVRVSIWDFVSG